MGQLGPLASVSSAVPRPVALPRSSFPAAGWTQSGGNNLTASTLRYSVWNRSRDLAETFTVGLAGGHLSLAGLEAQVAAV